MSETGWLPEYVYRNGRFESGVALFAGEHGRITRFSNDPADLERAQPLHRRAVLPGLVNAHSHTFQRAIRGRTEHRSGATRDTFWTWREAMYRAAKRLSPEEIYLVARMAFLEMLAGGITTVGEFHYLHHHPDGTPYQDPNALAKQILRAAGETGLRIALLRTAYVRSGWQQPPNPGQTRFITPEPAAYVDHTEALREYLGSSNQAWVGVAPHSVRAVPLPFLLEITKYARKHAMPLHMHVAEQPAEVEACLAEHGLRPISLLAEHGVLDSRFTGVHAIHVTGQEIAAFAGAHSTICACPTTERNLGDGINPAERWGASETSICFGTDSNIQIDLLEDARSLEYHLRLQQLRRVVLDSGACPGALSRRLFDSATEAGAKSLGSPGGSLEPGRAADFFTVDLGDPSIAGASPELLLSNIVFALERTAIREVFVAGRPVIQEGRHALQESIVREFTEVQNRLWDSAA
jgi:formimidoylglutamate deiminase